jgi:putative Mg2+ transporter-C (MgtC) family protein
MPISDLPWTLLGHLGIAAILGSIVGIERDLSGRPAGIRTNMIVAVGACLFAILSEHGYESAGEDPTRITSQIVTGIGFLGAGALLKGDGKILGLTTAADIWLVAAIGVAAGTGWYSLAIAATLIAAIGLPVLAPLSQYLERIGNERMQRKGRGIVKES